MKTILTAITAVIAIFCIPGCTKDLPVTSTTVSAASNENASVKATGTIVGRQQVISLKTGDYYSPTTQALLWLPTTYNSKARSLKHHKYPLIISLGGIGQNGSPDISILIHDNTIANRIADGWDATATGPGGNLNRFIVFSPTNSQSGSWGWSAPAIKVMLDQLIKQYRIDESRIYLTGLSSGGWGLWSCITDDESLCKKFAAIGPVSSAGADHPDKITNVDKYNVAYWNICGTLDSFYGLAVTYTTTISLSKPLSLPVALTSLLGIGHSAWYYAYDPNWKQNGVSFYEWLLQNKRKL